LWEVSIKRGLGREDFRVDPRLLRHGLLDHGYIELPTTSRELAEVAVAARKWAMLNPNAYRREPLTIDEVLV
jgi:hypothetical protein